MKRSIPTYLVKRSLFASSLFVFVGAAACEPAGPGDSEVELAAAPIVNGTYTTARPEVGAIEYGCTATLIGARNFLTAAHCIDYLAQAKGLNFWVNYNEPSAQWFGIERVFSQGGQVGADDLAIGRLTSAVPSSVATPAWVSTTQPINNYLTSMGYGCTNRSTRAGT